MAIRSEAVVTVHLPIKVEAMLAIIEALKVIHSDLELRHPVYPSQRDDPGALGYDANTIIIAIRVRE